MAIKNTDIVLFQSQDNTDNDSGGGRRTSNKVVDGAVNNLFPDISRIDTVSGDVALRKVFPVVNTDNRDIYYGAHAMLRKIPDDPKVSSLLFFTDDPNDIRREAQEKIEAYVVPSFKSAFYLYGNHIQGSRAVTWLQRTEESLPDVGETYLIKEGLNEQYIRIDSIEATEVTLSFRAALYKRRRIIATITQPLQYAFKGSTFNPDGQTDNTADTFDTQIADAAKFFGTRNLKLTANQGESVITVDSIFEQLVPSTVKQTPLINNDGLTQGDILVNDPNSLVSEVSGSLSGVAANETVTALFPILPSTFRASNVTDDGNGNIVNTSGQRVGSINYKAGSFTLNISVGGSYYFRPATVYNASVKNSALIKITQENQGSVYVMNLNPMPSIPNLYVDYRTGGKWYRMACNNDGTIGNDPAIGAGNLNDNGDGTGTASITLGSTPDLDSQIVFSWSDQGATVDNAKNTDLDVKTQLIYKLSHNNIKPETFSMIWDISGSRTLTVTSDTNGNLTANIPSHDATISGNLDFSSGVVVITGFSGFSELPNNKQLVSFNYDYYGIIPDGEDGALTQKNNPSFTKGVDQATQRTIYTGKVNPVSGSDMIIKMTGFRTKPNFKGNKTILPETIYLKNVNKNGTLYSYLDEDGTQSFRVPFTSYGTSPAIFANFDADGNIVIKILKHRIIDYTADYQNLGTGSLLGPGARAYRVPTSTPVYKDSEQDTFIVESFEWVKYQPKAIAGDRPTTNYNQQETYSDKAKFELDFPSNIVGEVSFIISNEDFYSKDDSIYDENNNQIGTINKNNGHASITYNTLTADFKNLNVNVTRCFTDTTINKNMIRMAAFRTASDDLVTSSFQLRYETINGNFNATSDANGVITGTDIDSANSFVDTRTGAVVVIFDVPANPVNLKYDAVAQTTLPLDPELLGLNPVRLPPNGKVPVFRAGYHLVIFHEQTTDLSNAPTGGQTITLSRKKQAYVEVVDVNGNRLSFDQYSADKENGTVTFNDPLSLVDRNGDAMTGPYQIIDRVEDMVLCTEAQITGVVAISSPLTRDYPADETRVASALVWGDVGARYFNLFSQQSFDGWNDEPTTNPITAQYDDVNYPIQINNKDSVAGRWMIRFTGSSTIEVVEEALGVVIQNVNISNTNIAPINPATGNPYWTMDFNGFGSGWVTGNIIRFNTDSGEENMWIIRTVQSGQLTIDVDSIDVEIRGDAN